MVVCSLKYKSKSSHSLSRKRITLWIKIKMKVMCSNNRIPVVTITLHLRRIGSSIVLRT